MKKNTFTCEVYTEYGGDLVDTYEEEVSEEISPVEDWRKWQIKALNNVKKIRCGFIIWKINDTPRHLIKD